MAAGSPSSSDLWAFVVTGRSGFSALPAHRLPVSRASWGPPRLSFSRPLTLRRSHREARLCRQRRVLSSPRASSHTFIPLPDGDARHLCPRWRPTVQSGASAFLWCVLGQQPLSRCLRRKELLSWWGPVGYPRFFHISSGSSICILPHPLPRSSEMCPLLRFEVFEE